MKTSTFRFFLLIVITIFSFPVENAGEAWYEALPKEEKIVEKDKQDSIKKSGSRPNQKKSNERNYGILILGFSLSIILSLFPAFQVLFIIPMVLTFLGLIKSFYKKPRTKRIKSVKKKRRNQVIWTIVLGILASLLAFIITFPYLIWISLIPITVALLSLLCSSESVKKGKSGKSCLVLSIILSVSFLLMAMGLFYLIIYAFS